jgi:ribonuclease HII
LEVFGFPHEPYLSKLVAGVDEAGRGSILGPLVIAGIGIPANRVSDLTRLGIRDSKTLTSKARERLIKEIINLADCLSVVKFECHEVDRYVFLNGLNELEALGMANVISNIRADQIYIDACDVNLDRYKHSIQKYMVDPRNICCLHHADTLNIVVSAASILAKIIRDKEIQKIRNIYQDIGSGYPSDEKTMRFIKKWIRVHESSPRFARKSWKPLRNIL